MQEENIILEEDKVTTIQTIKEDLSDFIEAKKQELVNINLQLEEFERMKTDLKSKQEEILSKLEKLLK